MLMVALAGTLSVGRKVGVSSGSEIGARQEEGQVNSAVFSVRHAMPCHAGLLPHNLTGLTLSPHVNL